MLFSSLGIFKYLFFSTILTTRARATLPQLRGICSNLCLRSHPRPRSPHLRYLGQSPPLTASSPLGCINRSPRLTHLYDPLNRRGSPPSPSKFLQQYHAASLTLSENSVALLVALVIVLYCSSSNHQRSVRSLVAENPKSILSTDIDLDPLDES